MRTGALLVALILAAVACTAEPPTLRIDRTGVTLGRLPPVLADLAVAKHLGTGLTTTLVLAVEVPGESALTGGAQVGVRFDLWDERFVVEVVHARGGANEAFASRDELQRWWQALVLPVSAGPRPTPRERKARVTLQVLPFSQAEQRDAQEWLLRSIRASEPPPVTPARPAEPEAPAVRASPRAPVRDFYGAMLASSIGRRSLITYSWTVPIVDAP